MKRLLRIWIFFYFGLYCLPFPFGLLPGTGFIIERYFAAKLKFAAWVGLHLLGFEEVSIAPSGSGDTRANYILIGILAAFAFLMALAWNRFVQKKNDQRVQTFIYNYTRIVLAGLLVFYGWSKVILPGQFGSLTPGRLMESFGDSSPMGLMWTFMAASKPYTVFSGLLEVLVGSLLFIPRLVSIGSLLSIIVMTNVFMLNICYDVPVKLFSFHLLLLSIFLFMPDLKKFFRFFILNLPTEPKIVPPFFQRPQRMVVFAEVFLVLSLSVSAVLSGIKGARFYQKSIEEVKFFGIWNVVDLSATDTKSPSYDHWARVAFDLDDQLYVRTTRGDWLRFRVEIDDGKNQMRLTGDGGLESSGILSFIQSSTNELQISGQIDSKTVSFRMDKNTDFKALLQERGFHWITERPLER